MWRCIKLKGKAHEPKHGVWKPTEWLESGKLSDNTEREERVEDINVGESKWNLGVVRSACHHEDVGLVLGA